MAESYSVQAILSAQDKNFSLTFQKAMGASDKLNSSSKSLADTIKGTALGMGIFKAVGAAVNTLNTHLDGAISRYDTMNNFPKIMGNLGISAEDSSKAISTLSDGLSGLPTTLDAAASGVTNFTSKNGDIKKSTDYFLALNNAIIAGGQSTAIQQSALEQLSQSYSKGKMDMIEWRSLQTAMPAQLKQVAKAMNMSTDKLGEGLRSGKISMDDFMDTIVQLNNEGVDGFASFAEQARSATGGIKTAFTNLGTAVTRGMANCIGAVDTLLSDNGLPTIGETAIKVSGVVDAAFKKISGAIESVDLKGIIAVAAPYWEAFSGSVKKAGSAIGGAASTIGSSLGELAIAFLMNEDTINGFRSAVSAAADILSTFAGFLSEHSDTIAGLTPILMKLLAGYMAYRAVSKVCPFVSMFGNALKGLAGKWISGLAGKLFGISKSQEDVGKASGASTKKILTSAKAFMMLGVGVLMISSGFYLLAQAAIDVANSGGTAIAVLFGLGAAVGALGIGMMAMMKSISTTPKKLTSLATAMLALGAAVLMISAGFYVLSAAAINLASAGPAAIATLVGMVVAIGALIVVAGSAGKSLSAGAVGFVAFGAAIILVGVGMTVLTNAAINLANAGPLAIGVMVGMVAAVALLAAGAALLAPALTAGAIGFIAFGAAIVLVATGALIASAALAVVAGVLPTVAEYGLSGALAITALGASMIVFAAGAAVCGVACVTLGAGLVVVAAGLALIGAAVVVTAAGVLLLAAGTMTLGAGLAIAAASAAIMAGALPVMAAGAVMSAVSLAALLAIAVAVSAALLVATASVAAMGTGALVATAGIAAFGAAMLAGCAGVVAMAAALKSANSSMKSIASNAKTAQGSMKSMQSSMSIVNNGLDAIGNKAKSAMKSLTSAFDSAASKAVNSGQKVGNGFNSGLSSGAAQAAATARSTSNSVASAFRSAGSGAYSSGVYIGVGLANGIRSQVGAVRSAAAQLASAAEAAIRAKARIHSPSKVSDKLGGYWGEGYIEGMLSKVKESWKAAEKLVSAPALASGPDIVDAFCGGSSTGTLSDDYSYYNNAKYTIVVPLDVDGREFARATATYTQEELDSMEKFENYRKGYR